MHLAAGETRRRPWKICIIRRGIWDKTSDDTDIYYFSSPLTQQSHLRKDLLFYYFQSQPRLEPLTSNFRTSLCYQLSFATSSQLSRSPGKK